MLLLPPTCLLHIPLYCPCQQIRGLNSYMLPIHHLHRLALLFYRLSLTPSQHLQGLYCYTLFNISTAGNEMERLGLRDLYLCNSCIYRLVWKKNWHSLLHCGIDTGINNNSMQSIVPCIVVRVAMVITSCLHLANIVFDDTMIYYRYHDVLLALWCTFCQMSELLKYHCFTQLFVTKIFFHIQLFLYLSCSLLNT